MRYALVRSVPASLHVYQFFTGHFSVVIVCALEEVACWYVHERCDGRKYRRVRIDST